MPTRYWLVGRREVLAVSRLESTGRRAPRRSGGRPGVDRRCARSIRRRARRVHPRRPQRPPPTRRRRWHSHRRQVSPRPLRLVPRRRRRRRGGAGWRASSRINDDRADHSPRRRRHNGGRGRRTACDPAGRGHAQQHGVHLRSSTPRGADQRDRRNGRSSRRHGPRAAAGDRGRRCVHRRRPGRGRRRCRVRWAAAVAVPARSRGGGGGLSHGRDRGRSGPRPQPRPPFLGGRLDRRRLLHRRRRDALPAPRRGHRGRRSSTNRSSRISHDRGSTRRSAPVTAVVSGPAVVRQAGDAAPARRQRLPAVERGEDAQRLVAHAVGTAAPQQHDRPDSPSRRVQLSVRHTRSRAPGRHGLRLRPVRRQLVRRRGQHQQRDPRRDAVRHRRATGSISATPATDTSPRPSP